MEDGRGMSITLALVICTFLICATILCYRLIDAKLDERVQKAERREREWEGRYYGLAKAFDKGAKCELTESALEALRKWVGDVFNGGELEG